MIDPAAIHRQAERLYREYLTAWLSGIESFFPCTLRGRKMPASGDLALAADSMRRLREASKEARGFGYSVTWREVNSRTFGRNLFPENIAFETPADLLKFLGKEREFARVTEAVTHLRGEFPALNDWIRGNVGAMRDVVADLEGLVRVATYFRDHPRPMRFARELPLPVDTKFIERHQALLRQWLDILLPAHAIRADEEHFERRFGLLYPEPHVLIRFLDVRLRQEAGFPTAELSLPVRALSGLELNDAKVFIVENKVNLLTLPPFERGIAIGALGAGVTILRDVAWLNSARVAYWGDIDVEGFAILNSLRSFLSAAQSVLMDEETIVQWRSLCTLGNNKASLPPSRLTAPELAAFQLCQAKNLRLEQERLPQNAVLEAIQSWVITGTSRNSADRPTEAAGIEPDQVLHHQLLTTIHKVERPPP